MSLEMTDKERILVVEDDEDAQSGFGALLRSWGFDVLCASNAEDVLTYFHEFRPSLLVVDVELPGLNGIELLTRLRQEWPHVPAIVITGIASEERIVAAIGAGAFWFLEKPINAAVPHALVDRVFRETDERRPAASSATQSHEVEGEPTDEAKRTADDHSGESPDVELTAEEQEALAFLDDTSGDQTAGIEKEPAIDNLATSESGLINEQRQNHDEQTVGGGMNRKQKICISAGIMLIVLAVLYPPWTDWYWGERRPDVYGFLLTPEAIKKYAYGDVITLHWQTLINEWLIIVTIFGSLFLMFREPKRSASKSNSDSTSTGQRKAIVLKSFGFGAGFAAMLGLAIGLWVWQRNRPKPPQPWNEQAIVARDAADVLCDGDGKRLEFAYTVENTTNVDYQFDYATGFKVTLRRDDGKLLAPLPDSFAHLDSPIFVPSKQKASLSVSMLLVGIPEHKASESDEVYRERLRTYCKEKANARPPFTFVLFDEMNRYQINLPKPLPESLTKKP
jgi:DNA-binding response OmpR family regulator